MVESSVVYLFRDDQVLMLLRNKKKKDVNQGKWIGVGGKKERNETIEACAIREVYEETGYCALDIQEMGMIDFVYPKFNPERIHVFLWIFMKDCPYFHYEMSYDERGSLIKVKELI